MIRWTDSIARLPAPARGALALAAGVLFAAGLPPLGLWPLAALGLPLVLLLLETVKHRGWRSGFGTGWLFGLGYFAVAFHWIGFAFLVEAESYLWMMPFMLGALAGGMAIYWGLAAAIARRLGGSGPPLALAFAAALASAEWLRGHLFTGFPWAAPGLISDGMGGLAQLSAIAGMTGLTLLLTLWAALPLAVLRGPGTSGRGAALAILLLLPVLWLWGGQRLQQAPVGLVPGVSVRIVQPSIPQEQKWRADNAREIFETMKRLSAMATETRPEGIGGISLLVWPESAVPFLIDESPVAKAELQPLLGGRTALVTGSLRRGPSPGGGEPDVFNSIIVFDGAAEPVERYDKWRLVPGGEFLPLSWLLEPLGFRKVVRTPGNFTAGPGPRTVELPGGIEAALLVCYEVIFPHRLIDAARRPQVLLNVTNDGWFGRSTGPHQHLAQARLRAIEQGLPVLRAANTGISAVIDPFGRLLRQLPLMEQGVIDSPLPEAGPRTVYSAWGDWTLLVLIAATIGGAFLLKQRGTGQKGMI